MSQPKWPELSIEELLTRARAEEKGALEELFRRGKPRLEKWASRQNRPEAPGGNRPSDIVQTSAKRAFEKFSTFKGNSEGEWITWLKSIVLSQSAQLAREALSQKRNDSGNVSLDTEEVEELPAPQHSPSQVTSHQEEWRQLLTHFFHLPEDQNKALSLFHLNELSVAEIAAHLGRSEASVASLMQRGVRTLKERMAGATSGASEDSPEAAAARNAADAALLIYFRRRAAGETLDLNAFASAYPACAEELRGMLHWLEQLRALKPPEDS
ncbi:RNA polymerase ECF family sigma subunit [Archangium gephyra]|uniref:RNA polymerase ECF family sigma subunit n=1 Tax=Archangium gephyra TaxID=48 RepID=A0AAC8Q7E7_9BACT|nr:sigma-70 family RNA polymerase sigma factor [Archangium gephyra]AKJ02440.1 stress response [Archangium gephyra]REG28634.1 RNA polymerase ECF family sigma subunit [Archangium gephyra]